MTLALLILANLQLAVLVVSKAVLWFYASREWKVIKGIVTVNKAVTTLVDRGVEKNTAALADVKADVKAVAEKVGQGDGGSASGMTLPAVRVGGKP